MDYRIKVFTAGCSTRRLWMVTAILIFLTGATPHNFGEPQVTVSTGGGTREEAETITLYPHGFEPSEITRGKGFFLLAVNDRSGLDRIRLRVEKAGGGWTRTVTVSHRELHWNERVNLPVGQYLISELDHPEWTCKVTITNK